MADFAAQTALNCCASFPRIPPPLVERPQLLYILDTLFSAPADVVVIDGESGAGKTALAAQFAIGRPNEAFAVFTNGLSAASRSLDYLIGELADQVHWHLRAAPLPDHESPGLFLREASLKLHRLAQRKNGVYYFILDGVLELAADNPDLVASLLSDYLPMGLSTFRFLLTGPPAAVPGPIASRLRITSHVPAPFGPDETRQYLGDLIEDTRVLLDVNKTFRGLPGKLASVRRLLTSGTIPKLLADSLATSLIDLFTLEWRLVDTNDDTLLLTLAVIAHARHSLRVTDVARVVGIATENVITKILPLKFVTVDADQRVDYVSMSFKQFAAVRLAARKHEVINLILDRLFNTATASANLQVPEYLEAAGRPGDVVRYLTPEYLSSICGELQSLAPVRSAVEQGTRAAREVNDFGELIKFSLNSAMMISLNTVGVLRSEVAARLELGDRSTAIALSQSSTLKEDRLELLAIVARSDFQAGNEGNEDLIAEIKRLAEVVDFSGSPERALKTAGDLLFVSTESALRLVESATHAGNHSHSLDVALAQLSMVAASDENRGFKDSALSSGDIAAKISNPEIQSIARRACILVSSLSIEDLLRNCEELPNASDALYLLGHWTENHPDAAEAWKVVQYGLDRILKASDYTPDARIVRTLATPLPALAMSAPFECNQILKRIDAQRELLRKRGPSVEYTRLMLYVAAAEGVWDATTATDRLEQVYLDLADLDIATQTEAFAWFLHELEGELPPQLKATTLSLSTLLGEELLKVASVLLSGTASHFEALRGAIRALTGRRLDLATRIIALANTQERRDALRKEAALFLVSGQRTHVDAASLARLLSSIEGEEDSDSAHAEVLSEAAELSLKQLSPPAWQETLEKARVLRGSLMRFRACTAALSLWHRQTPDRNVAFGKALTDAMNASFGEIDSDWDRARAGFEAAEMLAPYDRDLAQGYLTQSYELRRASVFANYTAVEAYASCLQLAVRAFAGLARRKANLEDSLRRLAGLIGRIPATAVRAIIWGEIATWSFGVGASEIGTLVVDRELWPILKHIADRDHYELALRRAAPALFFAHRKSAIEQFSEVSLEGKTACFESVCWFILTRLPSSEPFEGGSGHAFKVRYHDLVDILECLEYIDNDSRFYSIVAAVSRSSTSDEGLASVSRDQRVEIARRIQELIPRKLPDKRRIAHEGYIIAVEAQVCRMQQASMSCWEDLNNRAAAIPNEADRSLVLSILADSIPARHYQFRDALLMSAKASADKISSALDRIGRLESLAETSMHFSPSFAKEVLKEAIALVRGVDQRDGRSRQLHIVDLAYRIDPEFATAIVSATDDDPARVASQRYMKQRLELNDARRRLSKGEVVDFAQGGLSVQRASEFAWMMLRGLHGGRVESFHWERAIPWIELASGKSLEVAYPILSWLIENSAERHSQDPFGAKHLPQLFDATTFACDLAYAIMAKASGMREAFVNYDIESHIDETPASVVIHSDERLLAVAYIEKWLATVTPAYLKICDPYFGPPELDFLKLIQRVVPQCQLDVLTSEKHQPKSTVGYEQLYREYWRVHISDQEPPETNITIAGVLQTKKLGIHDRWWITSGAGLAFGGSLNGLGRADTTRITVISGADAANLERDEIDPYLTWSRRFVDGTKISYQKFSLS